MSDDREFPPRSENPFAAPTSRGRSEADFDPDAPLHRLASRGARLGAYVIDSVLYVVLFVAAFLASVAAFQSTMPPEAGDDPAGSLFLFIPIAIAFVPYWVILAWMITRNGTTPGKALVGIKIVREEDHGPIGFVRGVLLRLMVGQGLMNVIPFYGLVDALMIFTDPRRCIHDYVGSSVVIEAKPVRRRKRELDLSPAER